MKQVLQYEDQSKGRSHAPEYIARSKQWVREIWRGRDVFVQGGNNVGESLVCQTGAGLIEILRSDSPGRARFRA